MRKHLVILLLAGGLAMEGCVPATAATDPSTTTNASTNAVAATTTNSQTTTATLGVPSGAPTTTSAEQLVGTSVTGNRVILIGDSVMASTASRLWGEMCDVLVPLGWQAEVDAEQSKYIDFALTVLDRRLDAGWDVAVVLLGNNYSGDQVAFASQLETVVQRLAPRPTLLLTVSEPGFGAAAEVNAAVLQTARRYNNVRVVDWGAVTTADPSLLKDRVHLRADGREALAALVADVLGPAPKLPGECLETEFDFGG